MNRKTLKFVAILTIAVILGVTAYTNFHSVENTKVENSNPAVSGNSTVIISNSTITFIENNTFTTSSPSPSSTPTLTPLIPTLRTSSSQPQDLQHAVTKAISFFWGSPPSSILLMLNVMCRRFGIVEFADALQRYDQALTDNPQQASLLRVFRRIAVYDNPLEAGDLQAVTDDIDRVTVPALYCDRFGLPEDYPEHLQQAANLGDYMLTHALLAWIWIQENGCNISLPDGFVEDLYNANAALIHNGAGGVTDLKLEAAAFLYLAGQGAMVDPAFVDRVIVVQKIDGGWAPSSDTQGDSNWHTTVLALMLLLHVEYPADSYPPMLASASP